MGALDHGGGIDAARARWGGARAAWCDLSTGINPHPYPIGQIDAEAWAALPDQTATKALIGAARRFWKVPDSAAVLAVPGASAAIAQLPDLLPPGEVHIPQPTYNEHAAAFTRAGWTPAEATASARVVVHPNNPDGRLWRDLVPGGRLTVIDESFCDICPDESLVRLAAEPGVILLKSFGKFWGLAGLRLGFAIGDPLLISALEERLGPWAMSGPALAIGTKALSNPSWAYATRTRLAENAARLDQLATARGLSLVGGTSLFRLYEADDAAALQDRLAQARILVRVFPYSRRWVRIGIPPDSGWARLEAAL